MYTTDIITRDGKRKLTGESRKKLSGGREEGMHHGSCVHKYETGEARTKKHTQAPRGQIFTHSLTHPRVGTDSHIVHLRSLALLLVFLGLHHAMQILVVLLPD